MAYADIISEVYEGRLNGRVAAFDVESASIRALDTRLA